jgi:hypothetical protein
MAAEELLHLARIARLQGGERVEEVDHVLRVVPGTRHRLRAVDVRLLLVGAGKLQEERVQAEPADRADHLARPAVVVLPADDAAEEAQAGLAQVSLGRLVRPVPQRHVRHLVREHCRRAALRSSRPR